MSECVCERCSNKADSVMIDWSRLSRWSREATDVLVESDGDLDDWRTWGSERQKGRRARDEYEADHAGADGGDGSQQSERQQQRQFSTLRLGA